MKLLGKHSIKKPQLSLNPCVEVLLSTRDGNRTHTPKELDFESSASTNSAIRVYFSGYILFLNSLGCSLPTPDFQYFSLFLASILVDAI